MEEDRCECGAGALCWCAAAAGVLAFTGLLVYALAAGNTDAVRQACPLLWELLLSRCASGLVVGGLAIALPYAAWWAAATAAEWVAVAGGGAAVAYFLVYAVLEAFVVGRAMVGNPGCVAALTAAEALAPPAPLLGLLGWVCLALDAGVALALLASAAAAAHAYLSDPRGPSYDAV